MFGIPSWDEMVEKVRGRQDPSYYADIEKEAEKAWAEGANMPYVGVYVSPFGEHIVIPIRDDDIDKAIKFLNALKKK